MSTVSEKPEFTDARRVRYGQIAGYVSIGHEHGVELSVGADGRPVTQRMTLNLEHYYAHGLGEGMFVPRYQAAVSGELTPDGAVVHIAPHGHWQVNAEVRYRFLPKCLVAATFTFEFAADYRDFEAMVSNYFHEDTEPFLHLSGAWSQPRLRDREHRYWPRSDRDAAVIRDGRQEELLAKVEDFSVCVAPTCFDYPLLISRIRNTGWAVIHIIQPEVCCSLSANCIWHAHDFSLIGRDVVAGERIVCKAWMAYRQLDELDDALELYQQLVGT